MNQEQIINKALNYYKNGQNVFSSDLREAIDNLPHHNRIHTIIHVIKKINVDAKKYILLGKLNETFDWITKDEIDLIKSKVGAIGLTINTHFKGFVKESVPKSINIPFIAHRGKL
ncbi:MAG: hypothetical protein AB7V00_00620 [Bacilli bacterium]